MKNTIPKITVIIGTLSQELPIRHEVPGRIAGSHFLRFSSALLVDEEGEYTDANGHHVYQEDRAERGPFLVLEPSSTPIPGVGENITFQPNKLEDLWTPTGSVTYQVAEVIRS